MWPGLGCTGLEFSRPASGPLTRRESSCMLEGTRAWSRGILPMLDLWNARKVVQRPPTFRAVCAAAAVVGALFVEIESLASRSLNEDSSTSSCGAAELGAIFLGVVDGGEDQLTGAGEGGERKGDQGRCEDGSAHGRDPFTR